MKGVQTVLLLLFFGYLAAPNTDFEEQINELAAENIAIKQQYIKEEKNRLSITQEIVDKRSKFLEKIIKLAKLQKDPQNSPKFTKNVDTLKTYYRILNDKHVEAREYENLVKITSKEIVEVGTKQLQAWLKIKTDMKAYRKKNPYKTLTGVQRPEDEKYAITYKEFISNLHEFLKESSIFAEYENSIDTLLKKYNEYALIKKKTLKQKAKDYVSIAAFCQLREMIAKIFNKINVEKDESIRYYSCNLFSTDTINILYRKAEQLDEEEYNTNNRLKEVKEIFSGFLSCLVTGTSYSVIENLLEVNVEEVQTAIKRKYKDIARKMETIYKTGHSSPDIKLPDNFQTKINELLKYNESVINAVINTIYSDKYTSEESKENAKLFTLQNAEQCIEMSVKELDSNAVIKWFGIKAAAITTTDPLAEPEKPIKKSESQLLFEKLESKEKELPRELGWNDYMKVGLNVNESKKKEDLSKLGQVLENIKHIFLILSRIVTYKADTEDYKRSSRAILLSTDPWPYTLNTSSEFDYFHLSNRSKMAEKMSTALCYVVKIKKLTSTYRCKMPAYLLYTVKFLQKSFKSEHDEYPVLNQRNCNRIKDSTDLFVLKETQARQLLRYLQALIKQFNKSTQKLGFLLTEDSIKEQNRLANELCNVDVKKDLKPRKVLKLTQWINNSIMKKLSGIVDTIKSTKEIKSKKEFYSIRKELAIFNAGIEILELYTPEDAPEIRDGFIAYKNENLSDMLDKIAQKEKAETIRKSKQAFIECKKIVKDTENVIPDTLSEIGNLYIKQEIPFLITNDDSDSFFEPSLEPVLVTSQEISSEESESSLLEEPQHIASSVQTSKSPLQQGSHPIVSSEHASHLSSENQTESLDSLPESHLSDSTEVKSTWEIFLPIIFYILDILSTVCIVFMGIMILVVFFVAVEHYGAAQ